MHDLAKKPSVTSENPLKYQVSIVDGKLNLSGNDTNLQMDLPEGSDMVPISTDLMANETGNNVDSTLDVTKKDN